MLVDVCQEIFIKLTKLAGFSIGGFILVSMVYLAEISEQRIRGVVMSSTAISLACGMLLTWVFLQNVYIY